MKNNEQVMVIVAIWIALIWGWTKQRCTLVEHWDSPEDQKTEP